MSDAPGTDVSAIPSPSTALEDVKFLAGFLWVAVRDGIFVVILSWVLYLLDRLVADGDWLDGAVVLTLRVSTVVLILAPAITLTAADTYRSCRLIWQTRSQRTRP